MIFNKNDFPILNKKIDGKELIFLDSASTAQKPQQVIDAEINFYTEHNANVHRSVYGLSEEATRLYEEARATVARFINAAHTDEIVFTRGTTESINMVASTWASEYVQAGDEIALTELEHHSNLVPWQQLAHRKNLRLQYIPVKYDGTLDLTNLANIITPKTKLVACSTISNTIGVPNDVRTIIQAAKMVGAKVLLDAAQSVPHVPTHVRELGCDFFAFSGHKMLGPTGIGVLYIKKELHDLMPPYQFGGGMIFQAGLHKSSFLPAPHKFEAGTPPIAQAIGLGVAIDYLSNIDFQKLQQYEAALCAQFIDGLGEFSSTKIIGPIDMLKTSGHLVTFLIEGYHPHDVATFLSSFGICVRAGHHCAQPLASRLNLDSTLRASFYGYNTSDDVAQLITALKKLQPL